MRRKKPARRPLVQFGFEGPSRTYFQGEVMTCRLCWKVERSDPSMETQWRCIEADGKPFYFCPAHFPADDASSEAFQIAYRRCFQAIMSTVKL